MPYTSVKNFIVPVGVSFYTLQAISLLIEVRRGSLLQLSLSEHLLYLSFFPYFTSGPIERSGALVQQIRENHKLDVGKLREVLLIWARECGKYYMKIGFGNILGPDLVLYGQIGFCVKLHKS